MVEFWRAGGSETAASLQAACEIEAEGWDGVPVVRRVTSAVNASNSSTGIAPGMGSRR
jgi:hypothetical protein